MQLFVRNKINDFSTGYAYFEKDSVAAMARPESKETGIKSGVIDSEAHYLKAVVSSA